jgi:hypothetical protein
MAEQPFLIGIGKGWIEVLDGNDTCRAIFDRHYSRIKYADGRQPKLFVGPGQKLVLLESDARGLFVWRKFINKDGQQGVNCAVYRNESKDVLASDRILAAMLLAWHRWPGERFYTYIDPAKVTPTMVRGYPVWGFSFYRAGWRFCGVSRSGKIIMECTARSG